MPLLLLKYWKYAVILLLIAAVWIAWQKRYSNGFDAGVRVTEEAQALVLAQRTIDNEKEQIRRDEIHRSTTDALQLKLTQTAERADALRRHLATRRVCLDAQVPSSTLPSTPNPTGSTAGTTSDERPTETVGNRIIAIVEQCQLNTDKLLAWQDWWQRIL